MLFTFLAAGTDFHNNRAEWAVRSNVIIRKITNGGRSDDGAVSHQTIMSPREMQVARPEFLGLSCKPSGSNQFEGLNYSQIVKNNVNFGQRTSKGYSRFTASTMSESLLAGSVFLFDHC